MSRADDAVTSARPRLRDDLALMDGYHSPQVDVAVRLNTNESPVGPPDELRAELMHAIDAIEWHRYPDRAATDLRAAIADLHGVSADQVFAANGSNEVLQSLCLAYGGPARTAVVFEPTYALHGHIARVTGTAVVEGERTEDFALDLEVVERTLATARPALVFLCSPNNPTGMVESEETVRRVLDIAGPTGALVVVDEAYGQFAAWSALELVDEHTNLVVTRTYSKTWAMAAARLGYLVGPSWLVAALESVVLPYHLDAVTQIAGTLALGHVAAMERRVAELVEERGRVAAALADLPVRVWPSGANFILFRPEQLTGDDVWAQLVERSVLVRNCSSWPRLDGCLRVTIGTRDEDDRFLTALTEILT
jgi:histidinol-phosphate aminotransferase